MPCNWVFRCIPLSGMQLSFQQIPCEQVLRPWLEFERLGCKSGAVLGATGQLPWGQGCHAFAKANSGTGARSTVACGYLWTRPVCPDGLPASLDGIAGIPFNEGNVPCSTPLPVAKRMPCHKLAGASDTAVSMAFVLPLPSCSFPPVPGTQGLIYRWK